jgi:hypothetical protein
VNELEHVLVQKLAEHLESKWEQEKERVLVAGKVLWWVEVWVAELEHE